MRYVAHWVLGWLGAGMAVAALGACSLTSLAGLTSGDSDGGAGTSAGEVTSSSGGGSSSNDGGSNGSGQPGSGGSSSGGALGGSSSGGGGGGDGEAVSEPSDDGDASEDTNQPAPETDASTSDDAGTKDASSGGVPDSSPVTSTFCASLDPAPLFCDDFDEEGALTAPWDQLSTTNGSEALSTSSYVSAPNAMLVTVNPNTAVTSIDVAGYKSFTAKQGVTGTATLSFDIRVDAADESTNSDAILGAIQLWNGSAYWDLEFEVFYSAGSGDFTISMSEDGSTGSSSYVKHSVSPHLALGTWTSVTLGISLPAGSGGATTGTMAINGSTVASDTVHVSTSNPIPEILVGTTFATPTSGGWLVAYDNVTFNEP